jgi:hypothetical protein
MSEQVGLSRTMVSIFLLFEDNIQFFKTHTYSHTNIRVAKAKEKKRTEARGSLETPSKIQKRNSPISQQETKELAEGQIPTQLVQLRVHQNEESNDKRARLQINQDGDPFGIV